MIVYFLSMCLSTEKGAAGVHQRGFPSLQKPCWPSWGSCIPRRRPGAQASPAAILGLTRRPLLSWTPVGLRLPGGMLPHRRGEHGLPKRCPYLLHNLLLVRIPSVGFGDALTPEQPWEAECPSAGGPEARGPGCVPCSTACPPQWLRASSRRRASLEWGQETLELGQTAPSKAGACTNAGCFQSP